MHRTIVNILKTIILFLTKVWHWLGAHTTSVSSITSIIQTLAVLIGVFIAVNEFVVKDRSAQQTKLNNSYDLRKRFENLPVKAYEFSLITSEWLREDKDNPLLKEKYYALQDTLLGAYIDIYACINAEQCDENLTKQLFCEIAKTTSEDIRVAYYLDGYSSNSADSILPVRPLFEFTSSCSPKNNIKPDTEVPSWWLSYSNWREKVPAENTLRIHGPIPVNKYNTNKAN